LVLIKNWLQYKLLGETLDDAAGEAFDKVARLLGLGYPGGPVIAAAASRASRVTRYAFHLPRPMLNSKDYNFSFSGLKTAVLYLINDFKKTIPNLYDREEVVSAIAKEFQQAVVDVLIKKTIRAAKQYEAKTIILAGGVAANDELRWQMKKAIEEINFENRRRGRAPERSEGRDRDKELKNLVFATLIHKK
jgi:N6-L-threonylcarbamoyladenine synthase